MASKLDFDEEATVMLKKVESNVKKIVEHRHKYENLRKEREQWKAELKRLRQIKVKALVEGIAHHCEIKCFSYMKAQNIILICVTGQVIHVNSSEEMKMNVFVASKMSRLAILYFTATWCGPCRHIGPMFTTLASKYPKAVFLKVDIDEVCEAAAEWRIPSIPSFYLSINGGVVDQQLEISMNSQSF